MASSTATRIIDKVSLTCPGAMDGILLLEYYNTLKEFFARSNCWLFELVVSVQSQANDYIINIGQNAVVNRLMNFAKPRVPPPPNIGYLPMDPPQFLQLWVTPGQANESINPMYNVPRDAVLLKAGDKCPILRLKFNPQTNEQCVATLALNISDPMDNEGLPLVPDWIIEKYQEYITSGLISRMMLQPGKPYSSQQGAAFHGRKFNEGIGLARAESRDMYVYSGQRWSFPQGWTARKPRIG